MNITELLKDHQPNHSNFQMEHFIVQRGNLTEYGYYKQALRELNKRKTALKTNTFEIKKLSIDIDEMLFDLSGMKESFGRQRLIVELEEKQYAFDELKKSTEHTQREYERFLAIAMKLKKSVGELTDKRRDELDQDMWVNKIKFIAACDFFTNGRVSGNTIEMLASIPMKLRAPIIKDIKDQEKLVEWVENTEALDFTNERSLSWQQITG